MVIFQHGSGHITGIHRDPLGNMAIEIVDIYSIPLKNGDFAVK
jgi:hypothetical protein